MWKKLIPRFIKKFIEQKIQTRQEQVKLSNYEKFRNLKIDDKLVVADSSPSWNGKIYHIVKIHDTYFEGYRLSGINDPVLDNLMGKMESPYKIWKVLSFDNIDVKKSEILWTQQNKI